MYNDVESTTVARDGTSGPGGSGPTTRGGIGMRRSLRRAAGAAAVGLVGLTLAACAPGDGGTSAGTSCTNEITRPDATRVTLWAWYPAVEQLVDKFNAEHDD